MTTSRSLLPLVLATVTNTLTALRSPPGAAPEDGESSSTNEIRRDLVTLLAVLSKQATNYTLALKTPPDETAAFATLEKIKDGVDKLRFLGQLLAVQSRRPGELGKRLRWSLSESFESLSAFLSLSAAYLPPNPTATSARDRKQLLSSCKTFWNVVEQIERDLPASELDAVRHAWKDVAALLEDCEAEIKELSAGKGSENDGGDASEEETSGEMSETSRSIIVTANSFLRLSRLLVVRLLALTDPSPTSSSSRAVPGRFESDESLATLTTHIHALSEKADDLASALDEVQDMDEDPQVGEGVKAVVGEMVATGEAVAQEIERALGGAAGEDDDERIANVTEWLKVWRLQRDQAETKLKALLP
ncbi:hypothetical protein JCM11491_000464 [Sporobolomyces phaffii]